jgi:hypothetical protein
MSESPNPSIDGALRWATTGDPQKHPLDDKRTTQARALEQRAQANGRTYDEQRRYESEPHLEPDMLYLLLGATERQVKEWVEARGVRRHDTLHRVFTSRRADDLRGRRGPVSVVLTSDDGRTFTDTFEHGDTQALLLVEHLNKGAQRPDLTPTFHELLTTIAQGFSSWGARMTEQARW